MKEQELLKYTRLWNYILKLIYEVKWAGNNILLTAISNEEKCSQFKAEFYYSKEIIHKDYLIDDEDEIDDITNTMAVWTCSLRNKICNDIDTCITNVLKYASCLNQRRKGKSINCQIIKEDCSLQKRLRISDL